MIHDNLFIEITPLHDGAAIRFPADKTLITAFRARFPKALWGAGTRSWHLQGKVAAKRLSLWAAEQQAYLRILQQRQRDAEWEEAAPGRPAETPPSDTVPAGSNREIKWLSIPSQWRTGYKPPDGEPERAVAAIRKLVDVMTKRELFGFLDEHYTASYCGAWPERDDLNYVRPELVLRVPPKYVHTHSRWVYVNWRWSAIYGGDGWAEYGWHPDGDFFSLTEPRAIWRAINPGKVYIR